MFPPSWSGLIWCLLRWWNPKNEHRRRRHGDVYLLGSGRAVPAFETKTDKNRVIESIKEGFFLPVIESKSIQVSFFQPIFWDTELLHASPLPQLLRNQDLPTQCYESWCRTAGKTNAGGRWHSRVIGPSLSHYPTAAQSETNTYAKEGYWGDVSYDISYGEGYVPPACNKSWLERA